VIEEYLIPWGEEVRDKVFGQNAIEFYNL
jgi:L-fuconolactonase